VEKTLGASPVIDVVWGKRNLVEFALRLGDGGPFNPPGNDDPPDREAVNAAGEFLRQRAADYFRYVQRLGLDADIQDCCQDTFMRVWRRLARSNIEPVSKPKAFYLQLMRHVAADYRKRAATSKQLQVPLESILDPENAEPPSLPHDVEAFCRYLQRHCKDELVDIIHAFEQSGYSRKQTCALFGFSPSTFDNRFHEIRAYAERYLIAEG
jgi:DNA-directed RNA polymerase specialized sigma24 family protein